MSASESEATNTRLAAGRPDASDRKSKAMHNITPRRSRSVFGRRQYSGMTSGVFVFFVLLFVFFWLRVPGFGTYSNAINIGSTAAVVMIVSLGQALAIISGGFDLSVGGIVPIGAVTFAQLVTVGWSVLAAAICAVVLGLVAGLINAVLIGYVGINPLIATLGMLSVTGGIAFTVAQGVTIIVPARAGIFGNDAVLQIPTLVIAAAALCVLMHLVLRHTVFGRRVYTIGGNAVAARLAGIRVNRVLLGVYGLSGLLSAFAGVVAASQVLAATGDIGATTTLVSVSAVVLGGAALTGGTGGIPGTVLGVCLLSTVSNGMNIMRVPAFYQQIVTGAVLLIAVGFGRLRESTQARH